MKESLLHNWKSTLVGFAQFVNGLVPAVTIFQAAASEIYDAKKLALSVAWFLLINAILQQAKGAVSKDANKGSDRPQELVDKKLDAVPPFESKDRSPNA